ncbi:MAG: hypothetical protein EHM42_03015, partial [Planctomycetaceae bacterium]
MSISAAMARPECFWLTKEDAAELRRCDRVVAGLADRNRASNPVSSMAMDDLTRLILETLGRPGRLPIDESALARELQISGARRPHFK